MIPRGISTLSTWPSQPSRVDHQIRQTALPFGPGLVIFGPTKIGTNENWEKPNVKNPQYLRKLVPDVFNQHIDPIRSPTLRISGSPGSLGSLGPDHLRTATSGGGAIWSLAMSKDNSTLFCACDDGSLRILSLEGGVGSWLAVRSAWAW